MSNKLATQKEIMELVNNYNATLPLANKCKCCNDKEAIKKTEKTRHWGCKRLGCCERPYHYNYCDDCFAKEFGFRFDITFAEGF